MAQTLTRILVHLIFSTKERARLIPSELEKDLYAYLGGICRNLQSPLLDAGGDADHVHLVVSLAKTISVADLLLPLKRDSSSWMKSHGTTDFYWQDGYAAFSVGESQLPVLHRYLARQKEHHRRKTFKEELLAFLERYKVQYDERYLWE